MSIRKAVDYRPYSDPILARNGRDGRETCARPSSLLVNPNQARGRDRPVQGVLMIAALLPELGRCFARIVLPVLPDCVHGPSVSP